VTLRHTYLDYFFLGPEDVRIPSLGQSGPLLKGQGCHDLEISLKVIKGLSKSPTCIGTKRAWIHFLFYSIPFYYSCCTTQVQCQAGLCEMWCTKWQQYKFFPHHYHSTNTPYSLLYPLRYTTHAQTAFIKQAVLSQWQLQFCIGCEVKWRSVTKLGLGWIHWCSWSDNSKASKLVKSKDFHDVSNNSISIIVSDIPRSMP
jgi:hypothetical protein